MRPRHHLHSLTSDRNPTILLARSHFFQCLRSLRQNRLHRNDSSVLTITPNQMREFNNRLTGLARMYQNDGSTVLDFTNLPVRFSPNAGTTLPAGLSPDIEYFLRPVPGGYAVATSTSALPLSNIAAVPQPASFSFSSTYHVGCPNQSSKLAVLTRLNPQNDGTLKEGVCGYCLTEVQRSGLLSVPGTSGAAIVLMMLLAILMMIPAVRKSNWFKCLTLFVAVVSIVFLMTAISVGYVMMSRVLGCAYGSSTITANVNLQNQFAPIVYNAAGFSFGGSIPTSFGGFSCEGVMGPGPTAIRSPACYNNPVGLVPSFGAVYLIVALLVLFVWACVVACGIDFKLDDAEPASEPK